MNISFWKNSNSSLPTSSILFTMLYISSCYSSFKVTSVFSNFRSLILSLFLCASKFCFLFNWLAGDIYVNFALDDGACLLSFCDGLSERVHLFTNLNLASNAYNQSTILPFQTGLCEEHWTVTYTTVYNSLNQFVWMKLLNTLQFSHVTEWHHGSEFHNVHNQVQDRICMVTILISCDTVHALCSSTFTVYLFLFINSAPLKYIYPNGG